MSKFTPGQWSVNEFYASGERADCHIFIEPGVAVIERKIAGQDQHDMADAHLLAAAKELLADLQAAADVLRHYEKLHRAKGTAESNVKAEVNAAFATRFEATIAKATGATA